MTARLKQLFSPENRRTMRRLLIVLVALVVIDGILTEILLANGMAWESNPFLQPLIGDIGFMVLKVFGSLLCAIILWDVYRRYPKIAMIAAGGGVLLYTGIVLWNASIFLMV